MKSPVTRTLLVILVLSILNPGLPLFAQETTAQPDPQVPTLTDEVVVTARKKEETVQDVPFSIAAPTESQLRDRGAETMEDVSVNVAGFTVQNLGPGQSQVAMRGISSGQIVRDQPGVKEQVGVYLDESVISMSLFTPDIDLFDISRVEVLRGPQGTLFGSGSLSGTLRYISNQPKLGVSESVGELTLSSISEGSTGGSFKYAGNIPMGTTAALRVAAYYTGYGGYIDAVQPNLRLNEDVNSGNRFGGRVAFRVEPSDRLTITPRILYQKVDMDGWNRVDEYNILANPFTTSRPAVNLGNRRQFIQLDEVFTDEFLLGDLNIAYDFGGATLTSITSYTDRDVLVIRDAGALTSSITGGSIGLAENIYTIDSPLDDATQAQGFTQEVRLSGSRAGFDWVTGLFYGSSTRDYGQSLLVSGFETLSGIPTAGTKGAARDVLYFSDLSYDFKQLALFGEVTLAITNRLDVTGGVRYYDFEEDRTQTFDGIFADPIDSAGSTTADGFAPRVMLSFELSDATRLNGQISKGFRLGGINDPLNRPLCQAQDVATFGGLTTWKDEEVWNYEVGSKSRIMDGRGAFNVAAFQMDISDLQATITAGTCSSRKILNVPEARSRGVEVEFELAPNESFDFAISGSFTNAELTSTVTAPDSQGVQRIIAGIEEGNRLPTTPEFQMAAAATYRWNMSRGWLGYGTGVYQHVGSRFTQIGDQAPGFGSVTLDGFNGDIGGPYTQSTFTFDPELPAYDIVNLRLGLLIAKLDLALFVNNVTDEEAHLALDQERGSRGRVGYLTNSPRTIGISTRLNF